MRREHDSIVINVLDELSRVLQRPGPFHITVLATRANLPHDRLQSYLRELVGLKLVLLDPIPMITGKGREFLDCYHAWTRIQKLYGLEPRAARLALSVAAAVPPPETAPAAKPIPAGSPMASLSVQRQP